MKCHCGNRGIYFYDTWLTRHHQLHLLKATVFSPMERPLLCNHSRLWAPSGQGPHPLIFLFTGLSKVPGIWRLQKKKKKKMCLESRGKHLQFGILQGLTRARLAALLAMNIWSWVVSPLLFQFVNFPLDWTKLSKFAWKQTGLSKSPLANRRYGNARFAAFVLRGTLNPAGGPGNLCQSQASRRMSLLKTGHWKLGCLEVATTLSVFWGVKSQPIGLQAWEGRHCKMGRFMVWSNSHFFKQRWVAPPPELLTQEFASLTRSQVDAASPGTPLWEALV